jgi:hypothetical protein
MLQRTGQTAVPKREKGLPTPDASAGPFLLVDRSDCYPIESIVKAITEVIARAESWMMKVRAVISRCPCFVVFDGLALVHGQAWTSQGPHHEECHREGGQLDHEVRGVHG